MNNLSIKPTDMKVGNTNSRNGKNLMLNTTETINFTANNMIIEPKFANYQTLIDGALAGTEVTAQMASVLVVFDSRVQDLGILYDALVSDAVGYTIDAQEDALTVITQLLTQTGARRLAIVAHGEPGVVQIGALPLHREQLKRRSYLLQEWGVEEIALYSCKVGADVGFVAELEGLTGATVAAAISKVGSAEQGGSWNLNQQVSVPIFDAEAVKAYRSILAISGITYTGISGTDTYLNTADAGNTFTISGTLDQTTTVGGDVLIGVYSSGGALLYWTIVDNSGTPNNFSTNFNLGTALGNHQGGITFSFWQGNYKSGLSNSGNYGGTAKTLPVNNAFGVNTTGGGNSGGDPATGNVNLTSSTLTLDTSAPTAPTLTSVTDDVGSITGTLTSGGRTDDSQLVVRVSLTGTSAVANDTVQLYNGSTALGTAVTLTATNISNGYVDITTSPLADATYNINAKVIDVAGNASGASSSFTTTVDTTASNAPSITNVTDDVGSITGTLTSSGQTDDTQLGVRVSLSGTNAVANDKVQLYNGTTTLGTAVTLTATNISNGYVDITTTTLTNGTTYNINAKVTDVAGNVSTASSSFTTTVDTTAPTVSSIAYGTNDGALALGEAVTLLVTFSEVVTVAGGTPTLALNTGGSATYTSGSGTNTLTFTYTPAAGQNTSDLATAATALVLNGATIRDTAGNNAVLTGANSVNPTGILVVDTTAPTAPTITNVTDDVGSITGSIANSGQTDDTTPTFAVSLSSTGAVAGDTVRLFNSGTQVASYTLTAADITAGSVSITPSALALGNYSITARITDAAGNQSAASAARTFTIAAINSAPVLTGTAATLAAGTEDTTYTITAASLLQGFTDVDNDTLSVSGLTATNGTLVNNGNGTYSFTPNANFNGTVSLSYSVIDGQGGSTAATQSFTLAAVNDPVTGAPTATLAAGTEDQSYTVTATQLLQGFSDVDIATNGQSLSVTNLTASNGTVTNNGNGTYTITPTANFNGNVTLTYSVTDGNGSTLTGQTRTYAVAAVNDAPTGSATATLTPGTEDTTYTITAASLLQGFSDVDGDNLSVSGLTASNGTITTNPDGSYSFTPAANYNGVVNLNYSVIDGNGGSIAANQSISLAAVNDAPIGTASATLATGTEDTAYTITAASLLQGFSDVDGDTLSVANLTASNGTLVNNNNGSYSFTPAANYNGVVNLNYSVIDGNGGSIAANQSISFAAVNDAPIGTASATLATGTEDTAYTITAASLLQGFSDVDGDTLSVANLTASNGTLVNNNNGSYSFTPAANYNGVVNLNYSVIDGNGGSIAANQSISFAAVNDAPIGTASATLTSGTEDTAYTITAASLLQGFSDVDGDTLSVANLTATNGTLVNNNNGSYSFTPAANYNGVVNLNYSVIDGNGGSIAANQSFSLAAVNDAPTGTASATLTSGTEDTTYTITAADLLTGFTDVDGDTLSVSGLTASNGTITTNPDGTYTFTPAANYNGVVNLNYSVIDGNGGSIAANQSFSLAAVNDAPIGTASASLIAGTEDTTYTITAASLLQGFSDVDGDNLSVSGLTASNGTITTNPDGSYSFTPAANYNGVVNLNYSVIDGNGGSIAANQSISFAAVNDAPIGTASATLTSGTEDTAYTITAADLLQGFSDVDGDSLSVSGLTASNGTITTNPDGTYTFTPAANYNGVVNLNYSVIDGNGGSIAATQSFSFAAVNDAPTGTASATLTSGTEDTTYTITAADLLTGFTDVDGDTLSVSGLTASNGTITTNPDGSYSFTPAANYNGVVNLNYSVIDGNGGSIAANQSFSLAAVNDAPIGTASASLIAGTEDTTYNITAADLLQGFSDVDGDNLSVSGLTASNGTITTNPDGSYSFTPAANYNGVVNLNYSVIDGNGGSIAANQSFSLAAVNDAPIGTASATLTPGTEDTAYTITAASLLQGFSDVDGDTLSVANLTASNGTLVNNNNGSYSFTPAANYNGVVNLNYSVIDGNGGSIAANQSISFAAVNDAPIGTASATLTSGTEDTAYTITAASLLQGFSDVDGDTLSVANLTATNGTLVNNNNGSYSFTPAANYNGVVNLNYSVIDGNGGSIAANQSISFAAVNDAPIGTASATLTSGTEDTAYTITAADLLQGFSDVDGDSLSVSGLTASNGTITTNPDGTYTFTPAANYNGVVNLNYSVIDGNGGSIAANQSFSLAAVNDAPTGTASATLTPGTEDTAYTITATDLLQGFSDVDGDTLSVANLTATNGTLVNNNNGSYSFTPAANYNGVVNLNYSVIDGNGGSIAANQSISFAAVNDAPIGTASATLTSGTEDTAYTITAASLLQGFSDVDGDTLSVANLTATNGTLVNNNNGSYSFTPAANYNGVVNLNYSVIDGNGGSIAANQSFSLAAVNDAPTGTASATLTPGTEDTAYTITATDLLQGFSDVDGDTLSVANLTATNGTLVNNNNGSYSFTPAANYNGVVNLNYSVIDGNGGSIAANQSISFAAVNDAPIGTASATLTSGTEDTAYTITAADLLQGFSDVDGDSLSVSGLTASNGTITTNPDGTYTFTPAANYNGVVNLNYSVIDGNGGSIAANQSFSLAAVNDAPIGTASATLTSGTEDTAYTITAADLLQGFSDVDGDNLSVSGLTASNGTITTNPDGSYSFTPAANYNGVVNLNYSVIDGNGGSIAANQSFSLAAVNDAPTGTASATLTPGTEDTAYTITATDLLQGFSDVDGDTLSVANLTATNGTLVNNNNGSYSFTPAANYNGVVNLNYSVIDGNGGSIAANQSISFAAVNDAPIGTASATLTSGTEDTAYTITAADLLQGFSDVDGDSLSVSGLTASNGTITTNPDGTYTFTPAANYNGVVNLNYSVIDGNGGSIAANQSFSFAAVNDAPVLSAISNVNLAENATSGTVIATAAATDVDGDSLSYSLVNAPVNGSNNPLFAINSTTGVITLTAAGASTINFESATKNYNLTVQTSDGSKTASKSFTVNLTDVNEAPTAVTLSNTLTSLAENTAIGTGIKVADIAITDDALGSNALSLTGADAASFTIINNALYYTGSSPDFETKSAYSVTVVATDAALNASVNQAFTLNITDVNEVPIDTTPPDAPTIALVASDNRVNSTEKAAGVTISGTAEANSTLSLTWGGNTLTTTADANGNWSRAFTNAQIPADGNRTISVTATDAAGNTSAASARSVLIDTLAPTAPAITATGGTDSIVSGLAGDAQVVGTGEVGSTVAVRFGNTVLGTAITQANGSWTYALTPANITTIGEGSNKTITATATDAAGNTSGLSAPRTFTVDTVAPNAASITNVTDNVGSIQTAVANGGSTDDTTPTFVIGLTGTNAVAGNTVRLFNGSTQIGTAVTLTGSNISAGSVSITPTALAQGNYSITASITDAAGNQSAASAAHTLTIDTAAPTAPGISIVAGDDRVNNTEKNAGVTVSGIAEVGSTVSVTWGSTTLAATADATGNWSRAFTTAQIPANGSTTISATAKDAAGNTSPIGTRSVLIDTIANTPVLALANDSGTSNTDRITSFGTVTVGGLEGGANWQYSTNNGTNWTNGIGASFTLTGDGAKSVIVRQTDAAGNTSSNSSPFSFTLDSAVPTAPVINGFSNASGSTLTLTGAAEANSTVAILNGNTTVGTAVTNSSGIWSFGTSNLSGGTFNITATATDAAGNTSPSSTAANIIAGTSGNGNPANNTLTGTAANNVLVGYTGNDNLSGLDGNDTLLGGDGNDTLLGGNGNDILVGGGGDDILTGGAGNDKFAYQAFTDRGTVGDTITDFIFSQDQLVLTDLLRSVGYSGTNPIADGYLRFNQSGTTTQVQIDQNGLTGGSTFSTLTTLNNVTATNLTINTNVLI